MHSVNEKLSRSYMHDHWVSVRFAADKMTLSTLIVFVCFVHREFMSIRFYYYIVKIITFFNITLNK